MNPSENLVEIALNAKIQISKVVARLDELGWEDIKGGIILKADMIKGKTDKDYAERARKNLYWRAKRIGNYAFCGNASLSQREKKYFFSVLFYDDGEDIYSAQNGFASAEEGKSALETYLRKNLPEFFEK